MLAHRVWSVGHSRQFLLIFGTPIPGYVAPGEGPAVQTNPSCDEVGVGVLSRGTASGR